MSLMSSLYIGVSGLGASQNSLNTTAHNLANVDTAGYVRQQVLQVDSTYLNWGATHISTLQSGLGVDIATVRQVRDMFLDKSYRQEVGRQGFYEVQNEAVEEIESMFGELEGVTFQDNLKGLWTSLQELEKDTSAVTRESLIQTAGKFIERAQIISKQLNDYQINLNKQITNKVNRVNEIAAGINTLNGNIRYYESGGIERANDLRDERNNLLDELGQIVSITYKETTNGTVTVNAEGVPLVLEDQANKMGTKKVSETSDMLKPIWIANGNIDVFNLDKATSSEDNTDIGSLKGLLVTRGSESANYTDIPFIATNATEAEKTAIKTEYNNTIDASVIKTVQAQFDQLIHGIVTTINDVLSPNITVTLDNGTTKTKVKVLDVANAPVSGDSSKTMGEALFNRKSMDRYRKPTQYEIDNSGGLITSQSRVYNEEDPSDNYSLFTLGEIKINPIISSDYSKIPLNAGSGSGFDIKTTEALITKWQGAFATLSPNTLTMNNFNEYYTAFIGELANRGKQLDTISANQASMVGSIDNQRQQVAGVSSDEELTNLVKFQHAYNASARYISVISEMLEHVISRLGS